MTSFSGSTLSVNRRPRHRDKPLGDVMAGNRVITQPGPQADCEGVWRDAASCLPFDSVMSQDSAEGSHVSEEWCNEIRTRPSSLWYANV